MSKVSSAIRVRVEAQGFLGLDDRRIGPLNHWLRLSPATCMLWATVGTALQSPTVLWTVAPFALLGALLPGSTGQSTRGAGGVSPFEVCGL